MLDCRVIVRIRRKDGLLGVDFCVRAREWKTKYYVFCPFRCMQVHCMCMLILCDCTVYIY